jgi:hypothetical protein
MTSIRYRSATPAEEGMNLAPPSTLECFPMRGFILWCCDRKALSWEVIVMFAGLEFLEEIKEVLEFLIVKCFVVSCE